MPFIKVYIHFVWSTKNRIPFLNNKELRVKVWNHIKENAREKGVFIDFISGYSDHCHCLISLGSDQTIQKTIQLFTHNHFTFTYSTIFSFSMYKINSIT